MARGPLITVKTAADALGISPQQLRKLVNDGAIAYVDLSVKRARKTIRFSQVDIDAFLLRRESGAPAVPTSPLAIERAAKRQRQDAVIARAQPTAREAAALRRRPSFVYFIRSGPFVKIGTTRNLSHRLNNIQTSHPTQLELVGSTPGDKRTERGLHQRFASLRVSGEWFREVDALAVYVANLGRVG